ncbi:ABC transporter permease [Danxiaibacter flavus]|uniref:ABC transporter permease n=1 Tax=Danxiaibacter flavus TaxID=3049108 RepID=A0ABV3Z8V2_9BACT|nr:ABC transporter permease [Chitinophagaceae bacterium DXS]
MLFNYIRIALRNIAKHKLFSFINIFGLGLSMSLGLIIIMSVKEDLSYDKFHPFVNRTYRVISEVRDQQGNKLRMASTPLPLAETLEKEKNVIEKTAELYPSLKDEGNVGDRRLHVNGAFTNQSFFDIFGYELEEGNRSELLNTPNSIVISKATAIRYFGNEEAVGKNISFDRLGNFTVTGVLKEDKRKSHLSFEAYASILAVPLLEKTGRLSSIQNDWQNAISGYTYLLLKEQANRQQLHGVLSRITNTVNKLAGTDSKQTIQFDTQSLSEITPGEELAFSIDKGTSRGKMLAAIGIGFIVLLSACFNYTNLSIARSLNRAKEVGVRKISGASRRQIFGQFITEAIVLSFLSLIVAYFLLSVTITYAPFSAEFIPQFHFDYTLLLALIAFCLFIGLLAGIVPALALSAFKPVEVLKNLFTVKLFGGNSFRKILLVFQFSLSIFTIVFMLVFYRQFTFSANADHGFNAKNVLNIPLSGAPYKILANDIRNMSGVELVSGTSTNLGKYTTGTVRTKKEGDENIIDADYYFTDNDFVPDMQLKVLAGNLQLKTTDSTERYVVINEKAAALLKLGSPRSAVGQTILMDDSARVTVSAVVKDFYFRSFSFPITPLLLRYNPQEFKYLNIRVAPSANKDYIVDRIAQLWKKTNTGQPFVYGWLDKEIYDENLQWSTISFLGFLAIMTISIACLGMLGIAVYTTETRRKEIVIRKVMGAEIRSIVLLLSKAFIKLVFIAGLIALPIGYVLGYIFLNFFANRVSIGAGTLSLAFLSVFLLVILTISSQIIKVANANPATGLRNE